MSALDRKAHWENVYATKDENSVSWFEESPTVSLDLLHTTGVDTGASIIDIGGGASRLVDALVDEGFAVTVLDLSKKALTTAKAKAGRTRQQSAMGRSRRDDMGAIRDLRRVARPCGLPFPD
jgi:2-polyprenyl-3-methyl-5-hydroxy-6-metoxy-1,4-benzoquinol methylase